MHRSPLAALLLATLLTLGCTAAASANEPMLEAPTLSPVAAGQGKVRVTVEAGVDGAPAGFTVWWMPRSRFEEFGGQWANVPAWARRSASFVGEATLNTWGESEQSFLLGGRARLDVELGDLFDESGVIAPADEMVPAEEYVMTAFSNTTESGARGLFSVTVSSTTQSAGQNCTYTQGYWKTHPEAWPVSSLTLGTVTYSKSQLLSILSRSVGGNGLISMARQLIAAKLNLAAGASPTSVSGTVAYADGLIGSLVVPPVGSGFLAPSATSSITQGLDDFNNGVSGPGHCGSTASRASTWGAVKSMHR